MKKHYSLSKFGLFIVGISILIHFQTAQGQTTIVANTINTSGTTTSVSANDWENVGSAVSVSLNSGDKVLVLGTMEADITSGNSDITCGYRLSDGTTNSPVINRYVASKVYDDAGMAAIGYIFTYSGASGTKNFNLQHAKTTESGANKQFTTKVVLVAMVIDDANVSLPNSIKTTGDVNTTSTTFVQVTGSKTDVITLTKPGGIYLTTSFSTFGSEALTAEYVLRYSTEGSNFTEIPNTTISRTNSTNPGAATISVLLEHQAADDYYFDVAHKTNTGTLTTSNLSLCAVVLVDGNGKVFPTFKLTGQSDDNATASFEDVASDVTTSVNGTNKIFVSSTFNMSSASVVNNAAFQLAITGTDASFSQQILQRYVPAGETGSGGIVGLATGLNAYTDYTIKLQHRSTAGVTLTTSNANLVGFQLTNSPTITWDAGASTSDWNTANNWDPNQVPISNVHASIPDLATDPVIANNLDADCYDLTVASGATLTIQSTSGGTGSLIVNGAASGDVTVERFLTHDRWHYITGQSNISGNFDGLSMGLTGGVNNDQFYRWDESLVSGENTGFWVDILNGNGSGTLMDDEGFVACKGYGINYITTDKTLSLSGTPYTTDQNISLTKTTGSSNLGCNLVGNPFTSTLALNESAENPNNFLTQNTDVLDASYVAAYLWNEQAGWTYPDNGDYVAINNVSAATYIQPGQAFMVVAKTNAASLSFPAAIRKHGTDPFYKNTGNDEISRFGLGVVNPEGETNSALIAFKTGMTNGLDPSYDAGKMSGNINLSLYTKLVEDNGQNFAIQALPPIDGTTSVKLGLRAEITGDYKFEPVNIENFDENVSIKLEDKLTGKIVNFINIQEYTFTIDAAGTFENRFVLHFKSAVGIEESFTETENIRFYVYNNKLYIIDKELENGTIQLFNIMGQAVMEKQFSEAVNTLDLNLKQGYYFVRIVTDKKTVSGKIYIN
ncbi:MAG: T9SS type A sorting domain-containing protein [Bacteroidales bacterium]|nr:T9SS type A sorting domain-containing protein [Bacteroidales bacterium]